MDDESHATNLIVPLRAQLLAECQAMIRYSLASGRELPRPIFEALDALETEPEHGLQLTMLAGFYSQLTQIVAPATPSGLRMLQHDEDFHKTLHRFGPLPSIRYLMVAAIAFTLLFFGFSLFPEINQSALGRDIYDASGLKLLIVLVFLVSAGGLGATFSALFDAYQYVEEGSYETKYDILYWTRIGLGLVSGLMLSELIPQAPGNELLSRPLLALLGGFSAPAVHLALQRIVQTMQSLVEPTVKPDVDAAERMMRSRVAEQAIAQRGALGQAFDHLLDGLATGGSISEARKTLIVLLAEPVNLVPGAMHRKSKPVSAGAEASNANWPTSKASTSGTTDTVQIGDGVAPAIKAA